MTGGETILHLAMPRDWADALEEGRYTMSTRGRSLAEEGFIHCARHDQVESVANRFYADVDRLVVLTVETALLDVPIRDEPPYPGSDERFPHVYGPLPLRAIVDARPWHRTDDGWSRGTT